MKIALINPIFSRSHGGGENYPLDLARALIDLGHEVHLVGRLIDFAPDGAVPHLLTPPNWLRFLRPLYFSGHACRFLTGQRFDFTYAMNRSLGADATFLGGGVHGHHLAMRYPNMVSRGLHILMRPVNIVNYHLERQLYQHQPNPFVVANSQLAKSHLMRAYGVPDKNIAVVRHGIDHAVFNGEVRATYRQAMRTELGITQDDVAVIFVANNYRLKGLPVLIDALGLLRGDVAAKRLRLIVVGKGKAGEYRLQARHRGVADQVRFVGPSAEIQRLYAAGDVFALPTQYDPFAVVTIEAMACGLPAITSRDNGASEIIEHGRTGFVLDSPRDADELADCLRQLLDKERRLAMGQVAATTTAMLTHEANARATLAAFATFATIRAGG